MTDETELKPCPFCGDNASFGAMEERDDRRYFAMMVGCDACDAVITESISWSEYRKISENEAVLRLKRLCMSAWNTRQSPTDELPDHAKRFLAYMCAYFHAYTNQGGVSLQSEAANDSIHEIMELVPQEYHDLDFDIPSFGGEEGPWKCFHCCALFEDREAALRHFGESEDEIAACLLEKAALSQAQPVDDGMVEELETLVQSAIQKADDIRYYSGGSKRNLSKEALAERVILCWSIIRTALRSRPSGDGEWQPIETAPRDGTEFMALSYHGLSKCKWEKVDWGDHPDDRTSYWWVDPDDNVYFEDGLNDAPTHWLPLPELPSLSGDGEGE